MMSRVLLNVVATMPNRGKSPDNKQDASGLSGMSSAVKTEEHVNAFLGFLKEQRTAYEIMKRQFPQERIDLYQDNLDLLLRNMKVLMYYQITPERLDALLKLHKADPDFTLFDEPDVDPNTYYKIISHLKTLLYAQGHLETCRTNKPVDASGRSIPWITYPALEFLSQFDYSQCAVFEYGSGNSTLFWAREAKEVVSVESDPDWFKYLEREKPENVSLHYRDRLEDFISLILDYNRKFDVIVIDSIKYRYDSVEHAVKKIDTGGVIIFDNSDWYPNACRLLRTEGFDQFDFHGFGPINGYTWTTSLFTKGSLKFTRKSGDMHPIGGQVVSHGDDETRKKD